MTILSWTPEIPIGNTIRQLERGMTLAMLKVEGDVVKKLSTGQPMRRTKSGNIVGLNPSVPPNPPHVLTGRPRQSITHEVEVTPTAVIGRVGTNVVYARRLELGFVGTDAAGHNINQEPRPYLRPSLTENASEIVRLLGAR